MSALRVQEAINARELPWPIHASAGHGEFLTLTIGLRTAQGVESAESVSFPVPKDLVLLDGLNEALSKIITKANLATHMGLQVF